MLRRRCNKRKRKGKIPVTNRGGIAREYLFRLCISLSFSFYLPLSCMHAHALSRAILLLYCLCRARKFELRQSKPCEISNFEVRRAAKYVRNNYLPCCVRRQCVWYSYTISPPTLNTTNKSFFGPTTPMALRIARSARETCAVSVCVAVRVSVSHLTTTLVKRATETTLDIY